MTQPRQDVENVELQGDADPWVNLNVADNNPIISPIIFVGHLRHGHNSFTVLVRTKEGLNGTIKIETGMARSDGTIDFSTFTEADAVAADVLYTQNVTRKMDYVRLTFIATSGTPGKLFGHTRA